MSGWIKLHRKIADSKFGKNPEMFHFFVNILLMANHKEGFTQDGTLIKQGQLMTSNLGLSKKFLHSESKVRRMLKTLKTAEQIDVLSSPKNTIITVLNWDDYQSGDELNDERVTNERRTSDERVTTNKNAKNNKNEKNIIIKASPLEFLFPENEPLKKWLQGGKKEVQESLLNDFSHHVLAEEIKKAYLWQSVKTRRKSDLFLLNWMSNKKTNGFNPNQAQVSFSGHTTGNDITPQELERARELGII